VRLDRLPRPRGPYSGPEAPCPDHRRGRTPQAYGDVHGCPGAGGPALDRAGIRPGDNLVAILSAERPGRLRLRVRPSPGGFGRGWWCPVKPGAHEAGREMPRTCSTSSCRWPDLPGRTPSGAWSAPDPGPGLRRLPVMIWPGTGESAGPPIGFDLEDRDRERASPGTADRR